MSKFLLCSSIAVLNLSGCATISDKYRPIDVDDRSRLEAINKTIDEGLHKESRSTFAKTNLLWTDLGDPELIEIIRRGLANNLTLESAVLNIRSAQLSLKQTQSMRNPILSLGNGSASVSQSKGSSLADSYSFGASASYSVDLWGITSNNVKLSELSLDDRKTGLRLARIDIARAIAQIYFDIRAQDELIRLQKEQIGIQNEQLRLSRVRLQAGTTTRLGVDQLSVSLSSLDSALESFETARSNQVRSLAILLGEPPRNFSLSPSPFVFWDVPLVEQATPVGVILGRPDVERAERSVVSAGVALDSARKAWLPVLNVSANSSTGGTSITDLFSTDALAATISSGFSILLYNNGNRKRSLQQSEIRRAQSLMSYERTLLRALESTERLLAQQEENLRQTELLTLRLEAQDRVTKITQVRYDTGAASAFDLITEQSVALGVRRSRISTWLNSMRTSINMLAEFGVDPDL